MLYVSSYLVSCIYRSWLFAQASGPTPFDLADRDRNASRQVLGVALINDWDSLRVHNLFDVMDNMDFVSTSRNEL